MAWARVGKWSTRIAAALWPGLLAGVVAVGISWQMNRDSVTAARITECQVRPCYVKLEARVNEMEERLLSLLEERTKTHYKSTDAEREHRILLAYINRNDELLRKEMKELQKKVEESRR